MKLAIRLISGFVLIAILVVGINGYMSVHRDVTRYEEGMKRHAQQLGLAMEQSFSNARGPVDPSTIRRIVAAVNAQEPRLQIRLIDPHEAVGSTDGPATSIPRDELSQNIIIFRKTRQENGEGFLLTYYPLQVSGEQAILEIAEPLAELDAFTRSTIFRTIWLLLALVILGGVLMAWMGLEAVGRPLELLIEKTRRVGAGDLSEPLVLDTRDELAELANSLNQMCEQLAESQARAEAEATSRIATLEQLRHADRLRTVGRLASGMAHELGTPLNVVAGRAGMIASGRTDPEETIQSAKAIKAEAEKMTGIIRQLLDFGRRRQPHQTRVDVHTILVQTIDMLRPLAKRYNAELTLNEPDQPHFAMVDAGQIQQVFTNLIVNAAQAMPGGGQVEIASRTETAVPPDKTEAICCVAVSVCDSGEGIPPENLEHLFDPFYTTKDVGEGTGLGLSISAGIVAEHGGWIDVDSQPQKGSCFTVYLPVEVSQCLAAS